jgi:hypothetical protein
LRLLRTHIALGFAGFRHPPDSKKLLDLNASGVCLEITRPWPVGGALSPLALLGTAMFSVRLANSPMITGFAIGKRNHIAILLAATDDDFLLSSPQYADF